MGSMTGVPGELAQPPPGPGEEQCEEHELQGQGVLGQARQAGRQLTTTTTPRTSNRE